ncbi:MAG TPA: tRNA (N(6)-L-threonylcarbamoyladenosine(37)-C(2))-methylthiotransferase MtaB [Gemmataceae bacterium]|jgi:threonylcarbamoyladenosine tRNA methylthiotransferase MtaB|nr:tRNA (N(6)-L-threonylcarbamoyladenosine(37)-C(2))-methylthiotransferase MtaB [Gemmataceae bacterium]
MLKPRTCRLVTLGCKVNQYETQYVKEMLEANGYREAADGEGAGLCIVNTCTVTHEADAKGRQLIRRLAQTNPDACIVVMGCFATRDPETVRRLPGVTKVIQDKARLGEALREFGVAHVPAGISRFDGHQRAFVKVQDGCLLNCSFCIIPKVRPVLRSRPLDDIAAEVSRLVAGGCQEIVLTGIHLGHYGIDLSRGKPKQEWCRLWHLIRRLDHLPGDFRVRLSSLEAAEVRGELVDALAESPRICPHLHLCLQSGSDRILRLMKRRYRSASFLERCRRLRKALDQPAFSTDVIIGFPGETDADFEATCRVAEEVGFSKIHIFSYSVRRGTAAADFPERVPPGVIADRRARLLELERKLARRYLCSLLGRRLDVLVEGEAPARAGFVMGTSCRYAQVAFEGYAPALLARRVPVMAHGVENGVILALPEPQNQREQAGRVSLAQVRPGTL